MSQYDKNDSTMEDIPDTIYVTNLPEDITEKLLCERFGSIGFIKEDKKTGMKRVKIYEKDGKPKGDATVTYEDDNAASAAIRFFHGKEWRGKVTEVQLAQRPRQTKFSNRGGGGGGGRFRGNDRGQERPRNDDNEWRNDRDDRDGGRGGRGGDRGDRGDGGGRGRGGGRGGRGGRGEQRGQEWLCPNPACGNNCFHWRVVCPMCNTPKPESSYSENSFNAEEPNFNQGYNNPPYGSYQNNNYNSQESYPNDNRNTRDNRNYNQRDDRNYNQRDEYSRDDRNSRDDQNDNKDRRDDNRNRYSRGGDDKDRRDYREERAYDDRDNRDDKRADHRDSRRPRPY